VQQQSASNTGRHDATEAVVQLTVSHSQALCGHPWGQGSGGFNSMADSWASDPAHCTVQRQSRAEHLYSVGPRLYSTLLNPVLTWSPHFAPLQLPCPPHWSYNFRGVVQPAFKQQQKQCILRACFVSAHNACMQSKQTMHCYWQYMCSLLLL
jgi:hypothetical protein